MRNLHRKIETVIEPYIKEITDYAKNGSHPYELQGKPAATATGSSAFDQPPLNNCPNCRPNGGAGGFSFRTAAGNGGTPSVNTQPPRASLFGPQASVPTSNPPALAVPRFGIGAQAAANTSTNPFGTATATGGSNLLANPNVNTTNPTANNISSPAANTTNHPNINAPTNVTGGLFGGGLFGNTGTSGGGLFGNSNTTGGGLFGASYRPGGDLFGPYSQTPICKGKEKLGSWLIELSRAELWPLSPEIYNSSYRDVFVKLITFKECPPSAGLFGGNEVPGSRPPCKCRTCNTNLSELMSEMSHSLLKEIRPLCLVCVKDGKFTVHEGNCASKIHVAKAEDGRERSSSVGTCYTESDFIV